MLGILMNVTLNNAEFWTQHICWHINEIGLEHESNPYEHAKLLSSCEGRMKSGGLNLNCTSKRFKGGKSSVNFYDWNDVWKEHCSLCDNDRRIIRRYYAELTRDETNKTFRKFGKASKLILEHGDPLQNSKKPCEKLHEQNIFLYIIPTQLPNLNPVENLLNYVNRSISKDSL